ncbi:hypothetical protein Bhyg_08791, partial [Pseudolycoriella hygida]
NFLILSIQFLYQFTSIIELIRGKNDSAYLLNFFGLFSITLSIIEVLSTSNASQRIVDSAQYTANVLHEIKVNRNVDIDVFSTQMLLNKIQISECGMLTLGLKTTT